MTVILFRLVIHQSHVKVLLGGNLLYQSVAAVQKRMARAVPVHRECIDTQFFSVFDLLVDYGRIVAVISHLDVVSITEPRLKRSNHLWFLIAPGEITKRKLARTTVARVRRKTRCDDQGQKQMLINLHSVIVVGSLEFFRLNGIVANESEGAVSNRFQEPHVPAVAAGSHEHQVFLRRV